MQKPTRGDYIINKNQKKNDLVNPLLREPDNTGCDFLFPGPAENIKIKIEFASIFVYYILYHIRNQNS